MRRHKQFVIVSSEAKYTYFLNNSCSKWVMQWGGMIDKERLFQACTEKTPKDLV